MRTFEFSLISLALLSTVPALAADSPSQEATDQPPQMPLGGADPRGPGPLTVPPAEVHLPVTGQSQTDDFSFDYHGYFRAPLTVSLGKRANPTADQSSTTFHMPFRGNDAAIPDARPGTWLYNNVVAPGWASALFSYGNKTVTGTVGFLAYQFTASQDSGQNDNNTAVSLGPVFLHFNVPDVAGSKIKLDWDVGAFSNRYGSSGKYDYGAYGTYLFGATGAIGETLGLTTDVGPFTLRLEHGLGGNYSINQANKTTLLHHAHLFGSYKQMARLGLHYLTSWTSDERAPGIGAPDGRLSVYGADARFNGGILGELYLGVAHAKAETAYYVGPVIYAMGAAGGRGFRDNFFGAASNGSGSVTTILAQYDYSFVTLARYLAHYPRAYFTDGPDLRLSLFGTLSSVTSPDATYDGTTKSKLGADLLYSPVPFFSAGVRFDRINPTSKITAQSYSVISPRIVFKTAFFSHEAVTLQYSRYFYGSTYPKLASCGQAGVDGCDDKIVASTGSTPLPSSIDDQYNTKLDTRITGQAIPYDKDVIYLSATMWW